MRTVFKRLGLDGVSAIVLLIFAAVGIMETLTFPADAAAWPLWMWGTLAVLSLLLLISALRRSSSGGTGP